MQPERTLSEIAPIAPDRVEQELQDFSYMVSHDLAASFRHVSEFSRLLLKDLGDNLTPKQQGYAKRVQFASGRCQAMMEQLLIFSRAQQRPLALARQDATLMMRIAAMQLSEEVHAAGAEVAIAPLGEVYADADLLSLAFRHLLDNAVKFRRPGVTPRVEISAAPVGLDWVLRVSDNGLGVAAEYREKAFRMFQRLQSEDAYPGVGAGLALVRRIARRHGGEARFVDQAEGACVEMVISSAGDFH
jgi:light-regulated signal transduction histidine kinase (bacteriophytochrome)